MGLLLHDGNFDAVIHLKASLAPIFDWFKNKIPVTKVPIQRPGFVREIFSDASLSGWGVYCEGEKPYGSWSANESKLHINNLELIAAYLGLQCFASDLRDCDVLLCIDNTTAIAYINKMGGIQYPNLHKVAWDIWHWCEDRNIWVFASYIRSKDNVEADQASRTRNLDTEWELADSAFDRIINTFGHPEVDLFASSLNRKCEIYFSWKRDPEAFDIAAFTYNWGLFKNFYAFPPFSLILRILQKINADRATGILVVPNWPNQPWFPLFMSMLIQKPLIFHSSINSLLSPCRSSRHPMANTLELIAGKLSGQLLNDKELPTRR